MSKKPVIVLIYHRRKLLCLIYDIIYNNQLQQTKVNTLLRLYETVKM
jgi:hypothetical protein